MSCPQTGEHGINIFDSLPPLQIMKDILDKSLLVLWNFKTSQKK